MEKIVIDMLTENNVSIIREIEQLWRKTYTNSEIGRQDLREEVPEPYLSEILTVWGNTPTVIEKLPQEPEHPHNPTEIETLRLEQAQANAEMIDLMMAMFGGV